MATGACWTSSIGWDLSGCSQARHFRSSIDLKAFGCGIVRTCDKIDSYFSMYLLSSPSYRFPPLIKNLPSFIISPLRCRGLVPIVQDFFGRKYLFEISVSRCCKYRATGGSRQWSELFLGALFGDRNCLREFCRPEFLDGCHWGQFIIACACQSAWKSYEGAFQKSFPRPPAVAYAITYWTAWSAGTPGQPPRLNGPA